ncbi:FolC protein [Helicobacter didelphidarum]|uniref:Dihydrofolate synthase/folylpolyglutamate synthase n=2 Tax=Helicobacter didelphidarum TaxID=2040648 RepID=A0A3D8IQD0_9HELI|nr:FolC protein [Helicobacter didelphidarum]
MDSKAMEYAHFNPKRAPILFKKLQPHINISSYNIHIIGTNGKGSTGRFIAQSLYESHHSVLHFTSPHLLEFRERFHLNNSIVSLEQLEQAHNFLQQFDFMCEASYFEYATFLAIVLAQECEYLIMEAGVGGEYDSTSVLQYQDTLFTRIGIDHKDLLGDSLEKIALTKLRAAQGNIWTHFQENLVLELFSNMDSMSLSNNCLHTESFSPQSHVIQDSQKQSDVKQHKITYLSQNNIQKQVVQEYIKQYNLPVFLQENLAFANLFLESLQIPLLRARLNLRGRFEKIQENLIIDVGHNEMAAEAILQEAKKCFKNEKFILIYNSYRGKEIEKILSIFQHNITKIIILNVNNPRILNPKEMREILLKLNIPYEFFYPTNKKSYVKKRKRLDEFYKNLIESKDSFLQSKQYYLVFGSFSLVECFLRIYNIMNIAKS